MSCVSPPHQVRRFPILMAELQDFAVTIMISHVVPLDDDSISDIGLHRSLLHHALVPPPWSPPTWSGTRVRSHCNLGRESSGAALNAPSGEHSGRFRHLAWAVASSAAYRSLVEFDDPSRTSQRRLQRDRVHVVPRVTEMERHGTVLGSLLPRISAPSWIARAPGRTGPSALPSAAGSGEAVRVDQHGTERSDTGQIKNIWIGSDGRDGYVRPCGCGQVTYRRHDFPPSVVGIAPTRIGRPSPSSGKCSTTSGSARRARSVPPSPSSVPSSPMVTRSNSGRATLPRASGGATGRQGVPRVPRWQ
jgi:hypothetical protein